MSSRGTIVLFDVDGTLLRPFPQGEDAFRVALREVYGVDAHVDMVDRHGMTDLQILNEVLGLFSISAEDKTREFFEVLGREVSHVVAQAFPEVIPGAVELLEELQGYGIPCGLLTGNAKSVALSKLQSASLLAHFFIQGSAFGDSSTKRAELVESVRAKGFSPLIVIGDTPKDIAAGKDGGATTIGVATGKYSQAELEKYSPDLVVASLQERDRLLQFIL